MTKTQTEILGEIKKLCTELRKLLEDSITTCKAAHVMGTRRVTEQDRRNRIEKNCQAIIYRAERIASLEHKHKNIDQDITDLYARILSELGATSGEINGAVKKSAIELADKRYGPKIHKICKGIIDNAKWIKLYLKAKNRLENFPATDAITGIGNAITALETFDFRQEAINVGLRQRLEAAL